jgi:hypothetical protein
MVPRDPPKTIDPVPFPYSGSTMMVPLKKYSVSTLICGVEQRIVIRAISKLILRLLSTPCTPILT